MSAHAEPKTHDFTSRYWGHDFSIIRVEDGGQRLRVCVFSPTPLHRGDFLILPNKDRTTRYRIDGEPEWRMDPGDQYFVNLIFAPREEVLVS